MTAPQTADGAMVGGAPTVPSAQTGQPVPSSGLAGGGSGTPSPLPPSPQRCEALTVFKGQEWRCNIKAALRVEVTCPQGHVNTFDRCHAHDDRSENFTPACRDCWRLGFDEPVLVRVLSGVA